MLTSGSLCEFTSLAINQPPSYCPTLSLEQHPAQGGGMVGLGLIMLSLISQGKQFPNEVSRGYELYLPDFRLGGTNTCLTVRAWGGSHGAYFCRLTDKRRGDTNLHGLNSHSFHIH